MPFIPHTEQDIQKMLDVIGVSSINDLFDEIPEHLRAKPLVGVPEGLGEMDMMRLMSDRAQQDEGALCFIGAGAYEHHIPAAVWDVTMRGEFLTAYTPYQAEASQGTLQLIYEYQSMICQLTAMDVSNASLYDGASGLAEAVLMSIRANRKTKSKKVLFAGTVHPLYQKVVQDIVSNQGIAIDVMPIDASNLSIDLEALTEFAEEDYAALVIPQPNFFGGIEKVDQLTNWAHERNMLVVGLVNPTALALFIPPGEWGEKGADIAVGEGQPLGIPLASGGPYFGFISCKEKLVRQMPGRIIGRTVDLEGKEGFTLTLQAREQHIRRSKATSNICTNQGLAVTAATIYLTLLGNEGLSRVARSSHANARKLLASLSDISGVTARTKQAFFHEFVIQLESDDASFAEAVLANMAEQGILGGFNLSEFGADLNNCILVCATETKTEHDLLLYKQALSRAIQEVSGEC
ncbi:MAG: aminomethyl-transferring glycine dehydrogenase subunit GcvPA [Oleiphilus sp.]